MREKLSIPFAMTCGLASAGAALAFIATPLSIPFVLIAGGALGICVGELVRP
jgi:hypothetical protein